ncbi:TPA: DUF3265 domain-containing protein [Vibrio vulnificus]|nr:DUF3265 domain-containing protein [Vibrio vulnificus]HDY7876167.1 DUF3265 domain-containing protein [Vibrio vulnificus]
MGKSKGSQTPQKRFLTNASRRIRNAWHFCHALILVIKAVCGNIVLRCSPLKRALSLFCEISLSN